MSTTKFSHCFGLILVYLMICAVGQTQPKLKSAQISFYTPLHDDKDWDTKVYVTLYLSDGTLIASADNNSCNNTSTPAQAAKCFCCVQPVYDGQGHITNPNEMTLFPDGSSRGPFDLVISNFVDKQKLKTGFFKVRIAPNGNDRWILIPSITLTFDDGTKLTLSKYPATIVAQDAPETTFVFF